MIEYANRTLKEAPWKVQKFLSLSTFPIKKPFSLFNKISCFGLMPKITLIGFATVSWPSNPESTSSLGQTLRYRKKKSPKSAISSKNIVITSILKQLNPAPKAGFLYIKLFNSLKSVKINVDFQPRCTSSE